MQPNIKPEPSLERADCRTREGYQDLLVDPVMPAGNLGWGRGLLSSRDVQFWLAGCLRGLNWDKWVALMSLGGD